MNDRDPSVAPRAGTGDEHEGLAERRLSRRVLVAIAGATVVVVLVGGLLISAATTDDPEELTLRRGTSTSMPAGTVPGVGPDQVDGIPGAVPGEPGGGSPGEPAGAAGDPGTVIAPAAATGPAGAPGATTTQPPSRPPIPTSRAGSGATTTRPAGGSPPPPACTASAIQVSAIQLAGGSGKLQRDVDVTFGVSGACGPHRVRVDRSSGPVFADAAPDGQRFVAEIGSGTTGWKRETVTVHVLSAAGASIGSVQSEVQ